MKSKILKDFYEGNMALSEEPLSDPEHLRRQSLCDWLQNELYHKLENDKEGRRFLEKFFELSMDTVDGFREEAFCLGFRVGAQLMLDVFDGLTP